MKKEDLDKIITAALNVANENASVYGSQIKKDHKDKIIFRPDSYIKIAVEEPIIPLVPPAVPPETTPPPVVETEDGGKTDGDGKKPANASGGGQSLSRITMDWQQAYSASEMFEQFFQAVLTAYGGDNLKSVGFYKVDPAAGKPEPLEASDIYYFAHRLETKLKSIKYTLEFGVATVGQGERGGERILSLYDVISSPRELDFARFPQYKIRTINALLQIDAQIRQQILAKTKPQSFLEKANDFNKNTGWWNTLKDSFKGIQESLITRN